MSIGGGAGDGSVLSSFEDAEIGFCKGAGGGGCSVLSRFLNRIREVVFQRMEVEEGARNIFHISMGNTCFFIFVGCIE